MPGLKLLLLNNSGANCSLFFLNTLSLCPIFHIPSSAAFDAPPVFAPGFNILSPDDDDDSELPVSVLTWSSSSVSSSKSSAAV